MSKQPKLRHRRLKQKGMAVLMTAFSMLMLIPIAGLALDGGLAYMVKARLSAAADSSALAASRGLNGGSTIAASQAAATTLATTFFNGNFPVGYLNTDATSTSRGIAAAFTLGSGTGVGGNGIANGVLQVKVTASVKSATYFMKWLGYGNLPISATGTATRRILVMTLVLDKSASMGSRNTSPGTIPTGINGASSSCEAMVYSSIQFLNNFTPYDYIGVVPFDYTAYATFPPATNWGSGSGAAQTIANLQCGNNTNTTAALNLAWRQIQTVNLPLANNVIVLFTDGVPNGVNASFPIRTQVDTRLSTTCGKDSNGNASAQCAVPVCSTTPGTIQGVITQVSGFSLTSVALGGPYKMFNTDGTPQMPAGSGSCPNSGRDFAQQSIAFIPAQDFFGNNTYGPWDGNKNANTPGVCASGQANCTSLISPAPAWVYQVNSSSAPAGTPITSGNSGTKNLGGVWGNAAYSGTGWGAPYNTFQSGPYKDQFRPDLANSIGVTSMNTATNQALAILANQQFRPTIHTIYLQGNAGDPVDKAFLQMVTNQPSISPIIYEASNYNTGTGVYTYTAPAVAYTNPYYNANYQQGLWLATTSTSQLNTLFLQVASSLLRIAQ